MAKRSVLIIDKDEDIVSILAEELRSKNHEVGICADGGPGIERAKSEQPGIIILSLELDDMSGYVVCKKLKGSEETRNIPVIIVSRDATEKDFDRHRRLKVAAQDYLMKPFENSEILRRIENLIGFDVEDNVYEKLEEKIDTLFEEKVTDKQLDLKDKEIKDLRQKFEEVKRELLESKRRLSAGATEGAAAGEELDRLRRENENLSGELEALRARSEDAERRAAEAQAELSATPDAEETENRIKKLEKESRKLRSTVSELKTRLGVREKNLKELSEFKYQVELREAEEGELTGKLQAEIEEKDEQLLKYEHEISELRREMQINEAKSQGIREQVERMEEEKNRIVQERDSRISQLQEQAAGLQEKATALEAERDGLEQKVEDLRQLQEEREKRLQSLEEEAGLFQAEKDGLENQIDGIQNERQALEEELAAYKEDAENLKRTLRETLQKALESLE